MANFYNYIKPPTWAGTNKPVIPVSGGGSSGGSSSSNVGGGGRGGGGSSRPTPETSVIVRDINNGRGAEVIINGQGYSVLPGQVESFLKARG